MRIKRLAVERYKPFKKRCELELRPLTVLVGANNSGKSALAKAIPLFAGGLKVDHLSGEPSPLPLSSYGLVHGDNFEDLTTWKSMHGYADFAASFQSEKTIFDVRVKVQNIVQGTGRSMQPVVSEWGWKTPDGRRIELSRDLNTGMYDFRFSSNVDVDCAPSTVEWRGIIPLLEDTPWSKLAGDLCFRELAKLAIWSQSIRYLRSPRETIESPFKTPTTPPRSMGVTGLEAPKMIADNGALLDEVRSWYHRAFGVRVDVKHHGESFLIEVSGASWKESIDICQTGQGLAQVLPVAVLCMTAKTQGAGVDLMEHPEAELHPRVHATIADLVIENLPGRDRPFIVETHSEVFLLRVRRWVAEGRLDPEAVGIYWVERDEKSDSATALRLEINEKGEMTDWPEGVFQEDYEEIMAIRRAARKRGSDDHRD